ncbi:MAG: DUF1501 domain-containing protein, partial [Deltaproteobacteria bacterium]|nr:DUF1501 domain-containing protein [Nannocystaceae bacterium]
PMFDAAGIELEPEAAPWTAGGLALVDHPARPTTRAFFERNHAAVALLNGVSTRSVNHETCQLVALTGSTSAERADWGTMLGHAGREHSSLPHLVVSGPAVPGPYSVFVAQAQGRLQQAIDGSILLDNDRPLELPAAAPARIVDRFLDARAEAFAQGLPDQPRAADLREAHARARSLVDGRLEQQLVSGADFRGRVATAISALSAGICRCASVGTDFIWDTHDDNSLQSGLFEAFFGDLEQLLVSLRSTPGPNGGTLGDDTTVVVTSEMARTPAFNTTGGRDHWPYTSMLVIGNGVNGGRSYGGFSSLYTGIGVGPDGANDAAIPGISAESLGASLLTLGDVDPQEYLRDGVVAIPGLLR